MIKWEDQDYVVRTDGEGFEVPSSTLARFACCDCGLVHDLVFTSYDGNPIGIAATVNHERSAERRKQINNA